MIVLQDLEITNFSFNQRALTWTIESTSEALTDYELNVYRAEYKPQDDILANMTLVASGINAEDYSYINSISGYELDLHREFYYALEPVVETTGVTGDFIGPTTVSVVADGITRVARRDLNVGIRLTGKPVAILKKRTFGTFCTCYDPTLGRPSQSDCSDCYDTGFDGGYFGAMVNSGIITSPTKAQMLREWGVWNPENAVITLEQFPVISPEDVIVDRVGRRWTVLDIKPTTKALALIAQNCLIRILPKDDVMYSFTIPDLSEYD